MGSPLQLGFWLNKARLLGLWLAMIQVGGGIPYKAKKGGQHNSKGEVCLKAEKLEGMPYPGVPAP